MAYEVRLQSSFLFIKFNKRKRFYNHLCKACNSYLQLLNGVLGQSEQEHGQEHGQEHEQDITKKTV